MSNKKLPLIALLATIGAAALPLTSQAMHLDNRFEHNQYYHDRGEVVPAVPRGAYTVRYRGGDYLYHGGEWYHRNGRVAVVIAAPIGDLFESLVKRDMGTKDTGTLFGAHGGALDRVDALLFVAPAAYWLYRIVVL